MELVLGTLGVLLAWVLAGSQWWRARKYLDGISSLSWAIFLAVNIGWLGYGVAFEAWHLVANAVVAAGFNVALLLVMGAYRSLTIGAMAGLLVGLLGLGWSWGAAVAFITGGAILLRWPQIVSLWKAPSIIGVSTVSWLAALGNNFVWTGVWALRGDVVMLVSSVVITASTVLLVVLLMWRRIAV